MNRTSEHVAVVLANLLLFACAAYARLIDSVVLDGDIPGCDAVVIGTVLDVEPAHVSREGTTTIVVEDLEGRRASFRAEVVIKGALEESRAYGFRLRGPIRVSPGHTVCSPSFDWERGKNYLLFLVLDEGELVLAAEYRPAVEFDEETLRKLRNLPARGGPAARAVEALVLKLRSERTGVYPAVLALEESPCFRERLKDVRFRRRVVEALVRITEDSRDGEDVLAAYGLLGKLNETSVIPRIVEFVCREEWTWEPKTAAVHWLEGFPPKRQARALEEIAVKARGRNATRYAYWRLKHVRWLVRSVWGGTATGPMYENPLFRRVTLEFVETPFEEAFAFLGALAGMDAVVLGPPGKAVTLGVGDMTLADAIHQVSLPETKLVGLTRKGLAIGAAWEPVERFDALSPFRRDLEQSYIDGFSRNVSFEFVDTPLVEAVSYVQTLTKRSMIWQFGTEGRETGLCWRAFDLPLGETLWWFAYLGDLEVGLWRGCVFAGERVPLGGGMARFEALLPSAREPAKEYSRTQRALSRVTSLDLPQTPLSGMVVLFQELTKLNILLDPRLGKEDETGVTLESEALPVRESILRVARAAGLDAGFVHGVIFISVPEALRRLGARPLAER